MPNILIAEADGMMAKYFKALIEGLGYSVCGIATTTEEAARLAQRERPDLVLLDDRLPGGDDSVDLARRVNRSRSVPIVFVTALDEPATLARIKSAYPAADVLVKPVQASELRSTLAEHCH